MRKGILVLLTMSAVLSAPAQDTTTQIFTPLVNEVIQIPAPTKGGNEITITNLNNVGINDAPGSVVVITAEDIEERGYRDLIDIFMDIPGFNIATDVQNGTGIALRGAWASEAKLLIMMDGMILNDLSYGSYIIGGRLPLLNVDRIEIIRGASSSIYGGTAGLGVVNIITKEGDYSRGSSFQSDIGVSGTGLSGARASFANTSYLNNDFELSLSGSVYTGNRSNQQFTHPDTSFTSYKDSSAVTSGFMQLKVTRRNFQYKMIYDDYSFQSTFENIYSLSRTFLNEISYEKEFNKIKFDASINLKEQTPWNTQYGDPAIYDLQNLKARRITGTALMSYRPLSSLYLMIGTSFYNDYMRYYKPYLLLNTGNSSESFNAFAAFGEVSYKSKYANIFAGARMDYYEGFDPNFAPRISVTKDFKKFHYKLVYGESFKIPTLQNINLAYLNSEPIKPEKIKDYQVELGYTQKNHSINLGAFYTQIQDVIVYGYDLMTYTESYVNNGDISFAGAEVFILNSFDKINLQTGYAYYQPIHADAQDFLADTSNLGAGSLAIPVHKLTFRLTWKLNEHHRVGFNYILQSSKTAVEQTDANSEIYSYVTRPASHLVDLSYQYRGLFGFIDLNSGIRNVLNTRNHYMYPMNSGYQTSMGMGREFFVQLKFNL